MHSSSDTIGAIAAALAKAQAELVNPEKTLTATIPARLVGIAGEDDLDAPELAQPSEPPRGEQPSSRKAGNGMVHLPRTPPLAADQSAQLRERLLQEISTLTTDDALALWAHRSLPLKNTLTPDDAQAIESAYLAKLASCSDEHPASTETPAAAGNSLTQDGLEPPPAAPVTPLAKSMRKRSKAHLAFVASQPCLICKASPCDAHHLKIAQPRSLGRKVSDEFTVPLCRKHHRELHRYGNEANWWANMQMVPIPIARELWNKSPTNST